ncbi:GerAB/ArcD/ProY family transporter [Rossellomorea vietnamensis]|uniref:GerAB/ArcD/ProY family transporter n=1 Tax=Rossellomorea vietnamensis TaxID=218284 RepID=A0A5D4KFX4_9BACI|nr:GerAB/ArcD/ProY family transporter [Rossellomorea vietnamensis]TYR76178.1 GerAB/ArcD/ProY family transporter [Rossellomorea vietnamensis]
MQSVHVPENRKISPFIVLFLIHSVQVGVGVLGYQRIIAKSAGYDAWVSVIIAGLLTNGIVFLIFKIVQTGGGDLIEANRTAFGKWIGKAVDGVYIIYFSLIAVTVCRTYVEVVQVWMYPRLAAWTFAIPFFLLVVYVVTGGFRAVAGVAFFGTVLPAYLVLTFGFTFPFSDFRNLLPIWDHTLLDIVKSTRDMTLSFLGYETLLIFYPYLKDGSKSKKWAHGGLLITTGFFTILTLISFAFFSEGQLEKTVWATLSMWKIVQMPFVERFEYIGIANWCLIILPNVCIALWCGSRIAKRSFKFNQRKTLIILSVICVIAVSFIKDRAQINLLNDITSKVGFYLNFVYLPFLLFMIYLMKKVRKKQ